MILFYRIGSVGDHTVALPAIYSYISIYPNRVFGVITRCDEASLQAVRELYRMIGIENVYAYKNWIQLFILLRRLILGESVTTLINLITERGFAGKVRDYCFFKVVTLGSGVSLVGPVFERNRPVESVYTSCLKAVFSKQLNVPVLTENFPETRLNFTQEIKEQCRRLIGESGGGRLIVCCPGSNMPSKIWPTDRYSQVIRSILMRYPNTKILLIGSNRDISIGLSIEQTVGVAGLVNLIGKTTIEEVAFIISSCHLYLGNDTGPMHIAAILGKPSLAIFSARDQVGKWYPPGVNSIIKRQLVPCENCMLKHCNQSDHPCMNLTTTESVINDLQLMLDNKFGTRFKAE